MRERWPNTNVALHWLAAALIVGLATAGFVMTDLPADSSGRLLIARLHTFGGATLMLLMVVRLVVRRRGSAVKPSRSRRTRTYTRCAVGTARVACLDDHPSERVSTRSSSCRR